ncbi:MAG: hypothetical protein L6Q54_14500 [Leptospiraceae bacterium]|nr:hypothetical protein [Leptospiraceae bacterium]MCK6382443.1 hypothetical protein [Leptospiraceae bacterium]NUM41396.1 hypothetical protein [Leptospiraceae bacterium]
MVIRERLSAKAIFIVLIFSVQTNLFSNEKKSDMEVFVSTLISEDFSSDNELEKREISRAIVRYYHTLQLKDSVRIQNERVDKLIFLVSMIKILSNFQKTMKVKNSYGYMAVSDLSILEVEREFHSKVDKDYDIYEPTINIKLGIRKLNEIASDTATLKDMFTEYTKLSGLVVSFKQLEEVYSVYLHRKKSS